MKTNYRLLTILITGALLLFCVSAASSMDDPLFTIDRMVMSTNIDDREPTGVTDTFSAASDKVFCFLEAKNIKQDTTVSFVWYFADKEMARVTLPLVKGMRWRTYSSKKLAGLKGSWKVELQDSTGIVLRSVSFLVR